MEALKVLIVEDEAIVAMQLEMNLNLRGFQVCGSVSSGEKAIHLTRELQPDVVLMDRRLVGGMDGLAVSRQIRTFSQVPIIFLSGYLDEDLDEVISTLQPAVYLVKPVQTFEIENAIHKLFERAH
jgi:DNA-binding response OmpR family regulator